MISRAKGTASSVIAYLHVLLSALPRKTWLVLALMIGLSFTEWVGVLLLVPLLSLVGLDVDQGAVGRLAEAVTTAFGAIGLQPTLPLVLGVYVTVVAVRTLLQHWESVAATELDQGLVLHLRRRLYSAVAHSPWLFFARRRATDFTHALTTELDRVSTATSMLLRLIAQLLVGSVYLLLALRISPAVTGVTLASGALLLLLLRRGNERTRREGERLSKAGSAVFAAIGEHLGGMKTAKSYGAEDRNVEIVSRLSSNLADTYIATNRNYASTLAWFNLGSVLILSLVVYIAIQLLDLSAAGILLLLFIFARLVPRFSAIQQSYQYFVNSLPAFVGVTRLTAECEQQTELRGSEAESVDLRESIRLERVSFRYPGTGDAPTIAHLDLTIPARRTTAIVGPSGAGKSTVADLVMALIFPQSGRILVDGSPLSPEHIHGWRKRIGYVPQDTFLFHDTVRANLLWARPDAAEEELSEALRLAAADSFVALLPQGLETVIGDRGVLLSGGERQRLALARALLRKPALLILDEATSALDSENEQRIQRAIEELHGRTTILVITHRLSTIRDADIIYVLEGGRLVESGSWRELIGAPHGRFRELRRAQSLDAEMPAPKTSDEPQPDSIA